MDDPFFSYRIDDRSYVSYIKREIHNLVTAKGFSPQKTGEIDIIISELTSNLVKFAETGELLYKTGTDADGDFFETYCIDNGKGIRNLARMRQDGMSSSNTLGQGLGAIERLSDNSSIYTQPGWGTVVHSKVYRDGTHTHIKNGVQAGTIQVPAPGEKVCGDGYYIKKVPNGVQFFMGDGLGHGANAHEAATEAIQVFATCRERSPAGIIKHIHQHVKKTRGLVGTVAYLDFDTKKWYLCGIGNISTSLFTGLTAKNYTPYNGILGHNIPKVLNDTIVPLERYQTLIMHSDGLRARWNLAGLPGILKHDPNIIAAVLYKDNARFNDDMSVLAAKITI